MTGERLPLTPAQRSSLESQLGWWLGSVRRSVERLQSYDADMQKKRQNIANGQDFLGASSSDDLIRLVREQTDFLSRGFDEAQILANALAQVDSHLKELEDDWGGRNGVSAEFRNAFQAASLRDLRNAIEHMGEHAAGRERDGRARLSPMNTTNVAFKLELGWPMSIAMFGVTYPVSDVVNLAINVDEAWGGARDWWPTPRPKDFYDTPG